MKSIKIITKILIAIIVGLVIMAVSSFIGVIISMFVGVIINILVAMGSLIALIFAGKEFFPKEPTTFFYPELFIRIFGLIGFVGGSLWFYWRKPIAQMYREHKVEKYREYVDRKFGRGNHDG